LLCSIPFTSETTEICSLRESTKAAEVEAVALGNVEKEADENEVEGTGK
jgi:hypothetical protein